MDRVASSHACLQGEKPTKLRLTAPSPWNTAQIDLLWRWLFVLFLIWSLSRDQRLPLPLPPTSTRTTPIWGQKPVLSYFALTASLAEPLQKGARLSSDQFQQVQKIAQWETEQLRALEQESLNIIQDPDLTLEQKRARIAAMNYNQRVFDIAAAAQAQLKTTLGNPIYARLQRWMELRWPTERRLHGLAAAQNAPRTFRVYATRYDSNGAYTVALPDQCLKLANGGHHLCDKYGYVAGGGYSIFISYKKSVAVSVGEAGPWNVDDNYWAKTSDPQPRRLFTDLPLGMPEAQAAYFDGYNGGLDQFGRVVTAPFGVDLARQVSIDIGLQPGNNDWVDISFLWTEGWGQSSSKSNSNTPSSPAATPIPVTPVQTATPNAQGEVVHIVQQGQTLWDIATAYQVTLRQLYALNGLSEGAVIHPGDRLIIRLANATTTPTVTLSTQPPQTTPSPSTPSSTPTRRSTATVALPSASPSIIPSEAQSTPFPTSTDPPPTDPFWLAIAGLGAIGLALVILGEALRRGPQ